MSASAAKPDATINLMFSPPVAWSAEGARVGIVTCLACGAGLLLSMTTDSMALHAAWHERDGGTT